MKVQGFRTQKNTKVSPSKGLFEYPAGVLGEKKKKMSKITLTAGVLPHFFSCDHFALSLGNIIVSNSRYTECKK